MKNQRQHASLAAFALLLTVLSPLAILGQKETSNACPGDRLPESVTKDLPSGLWRFGATPYLGAGFNSRAAMVTSTTTDFNHGMRVVKVAVENLSNKPIAAVRLGWRFVDLTTQSVVEGGESELLSLGANKALNPGDWRVLDVQTTSFAEFARRYGKNGGIEGSYEFDVAVNQSLFSDGSSWDEPIAGTVTHPRKAHSKRVSLREPMLPLVISPAPLLACPNMKCDVVFDPFFGWMAVCVPQTASKCELCGGVTSCCTNICNHQQTCNCN